MQSGKTSNYTGPFCKATDAGYKVIIVLGGFAQQPSQPDADAPGRRLSWLRNDALGEVRAKPNTISIGVGEIDPDQAIRPDYVTTRHEKGDFSLAVVKNLGISPGGRPLLFVVKKNTSVLKNLDQMD